MTLAGTALPLAGVEVQIHDAAGQGVTTAFTNGLGFYATSSTLAAGTYFAVTWNELGYLDELYDDIPCPCGGCVANTGVGISVTDGTTTAGIDFALTPGGRVSGRLTSAATGLPLPDHYVRVFDASYNCEGYGYTGANGSYTTDTGLLAGSYFVRTDAPGYVDELYNNVPCPAGRCGLAGGTAVNVTLGATTPGIDFALAPGGRISGTLTSAASGLPVAAASVSVFDTAGRYLTSGTANASGIYSSSAGLVSGSYFAVTSNREGYLEELYQDISCPGGYCSPTAGTPIAVAQGSTTPGIDFALTPGARISGTVTDAGTGLPLRSVSAKLYDPWGRQVTSVGTNPSGVYLSPTGLTPGTYYVAASLSRSAYIPELFNDISCPGRCDAAAGTPVNVSAGATVGGVNFALTQGGQVAGTVSDASSGLPLVNAYVWVRDGVGRDLASATTDALGRYTSLPGLPSGSYYVVAYDAGHVGELFDNLPCAGGSCTSAGGTPVNVTSGATTSGIHLALSPGGRITGRVTDAVTGLPWAGMGVEVDVYDATGTQVGWAWDEGSGFSASGLPPGTYYARTSSWGQEHVDELYDNSPCPGGSCVPTTGTPILVTQAGTTAGIDFGLSLGGLISGRISDAATGLPLVPLPNNSANARVYYYNASGLFVGESVLNYTGTYTVAAGLPAGTYYARTVNSIGYVDELYDNVACPAGACALAGGTPITVATGATTTGVDFVLSSSPPVKGDVNGDGSSDLVFRQVSNGARNKVWFMNGLARASEGTITPDADSADWKIRGVDDFNADGQNDLVFWNQATGHVEFWLMNGRNRPGPAVPLSGGPVLSTNWDLAATADFNNDDKPDIVWRNFTSQKIVIWTMNGSTKAGSTIPTPDQAVDANWMIVAARDYNNDGNTDFLWYNWSSGKIVTWYMNASVVRTAGQFTAPANAGDANWRVLASSDYSRSYVPGTPPFGSPDIVWRNETSGNQVVWHLDFASSRVHGQFTSPTANTPALDWTIVGPR